MSRSARGEWRLAFATPELLFAIALLAIVASLTFPLARRFHWHPLLAVGAIVGGYGLVVLCLNFPNLKEDFLAWLEKKK